MKIYNKLIIQILLYIFFINTSLASDLINKEYKNIINEWKLDDRWTSCSLVIDNCQNNECDYTELPDAGIKGKGKIKINKSKNIGSIDDKNYKIEFFFDKSYIILKNNEEQLCGKENNFFKDKYFKKIIANDTNVYETSFKCSNLNYIVDIYTCTNQHIAELDLKLNKVYNLILKKVDKELTKKIKNEQMDWNIQKLKRKFDIYDIYSSRIEKLNSYIEDCNNEEGMNLVANDKKLAKDYFYKCINSGNIYEETGKILNTQSSIGAAAMLSYLYFIDGDIKQSNEYFKQIIDIAYSSNDHWFTTMYDKERIPSYITNKKELLEYLQYFFPYYTQDMIIKDNDLMDYLGETKWGIIEIAHDKDFKNIKDFESVKKFLSNDYYKQNIDESITSGSVRTFMYSVANAFMEKISLLPKKFLKDEDTFVYEFVSEDEERHYFKDTYKKIVKDEELLFLYNESIKEVEKYYKNYLKLNDKESNKYATKAVQYVILYDIYYK